MEDQKRLEEIFGDVEGYAIPAENVQRIKEVNEIDMPIEDIKSWLIEHGFTVKAGEKPEAEKKKSEDLEGAAGKGWEHPDNIRAHYSIRGDSYLEECEEERGW